MKKIIGLSIAAIIIIAIASVGTLAAFSDTEESTGNKITAGTLDLIPETYGTGAQMDAASVQGNTDGLTGAASGHIIFTNVAPGNNGTIEWVLHNNGSLAGKLGLASDAAFTQGTNTEPELSTPADDVTNGNLDTGVRAKLEWGKGADKTTAEGAFAYLVGGASTWGTLADVEAAIDAQINKDMDANNGTNDTYVYKLTWDIASATGNEIQGDDATFDLDFTLAQP